LKLCDIYAERLVAFFKAEYCDLVGLLLSAAKEEREREREREKRKKKKHHVIVIIEIPSRELCR
tara:strand:- start:2637 stop:2828 length:192 start_codon:yes stop_codon:yes gene_type:complete